MTEWPQGPTILAEGWLRGTTLTLGALILAALTAWMDRRTRARMEGRRRPRHGLLGSVARIVADLARAPVPRLWPTLIASLSLLPALMLVTILLHAVVGSRFGGAIARSPEQILWWFGLLVAATLAHRWILPSMWAEPPGTDPSARRHLMASLTPWLGLWVALLILLFGVGLAPQGVHPVAAMGLLLSAGLCRRLDAVSRHRGSVATTGASADLLARMASHLVVTALVLMAIIVSGILSQLPVRPIEVALFVLLLALLGGVFFSRWVCIGLFGDPTPRRLRHFAWGGLLPVAVFEMGMSVLQMTGRWPG